LALAGTPGCTCQGYDDNDRDYENYGLVHLHWRILANARIGCQQSPNQNGEFPARVDYNESDMKSYIYLLFVLILVTCSRSVSVPEEPDLRRYIEATATGINLELSYSDMPELLSSELESSPWPEDLEALADSLLKRYGSDPDLWYEIYSRILTESRR